jgi:signal transduction histidine kinase
MDARIADPRTDPQWDKLLSLAAHEIRSPLGVATGYLRMMLDERFGTLSEQQRDQLEKIGKSCGRMSQVLKELSELSELESGKATFNRGTVKLASVLEDSIAGLPELPERAVTVTLVADGALLVHGDAVRLRDAFSAILLALRRELVTSDELVVRGEARYQDSVPTVRIVIAGPAQIERLWTLDASFLATFDEWRGGNGLGLPKARRVIEAHGGRAWGLPAPDQTEEAKADAIKRDTQASAIVALPALRK